MKRGDRPPTKKKQSSSSNHPFSDASCPFQGRQFHQWSHGIFTYNAPSPWVNPFDLGFWDIHYEPSPWVFPVWCSLHYPYVASFFTPANAHGPMTLVDGLPDLKNWKANNRPNGVGCPTRLGMEFQWLDSSSREKYLNLSTSDLWLIEIFFTTVLFLTLPGKKNISHLGFIGKKHRLKRTL